MVAMIVAGKEFMRVTALDFFTCCADMDYPPDRSIAALCAVFKHAIAFLTCVVICYKNFNLTNCFLLWVYEVSEVS